MTVSGGIAALLEQATPGPWTFNDSTDRRGHKGEFRAPNPHNGFMLVGPWTNDSDARLVALAPDMASLLIDMAAALSGPRTARQVDELLARFAALEQKAEAT